MRQGNFRVELGSTAVHVYVADLSQCEAPTHNEAKALLPEAEFLSTQKFVTDTLKNNALLTKILTRKILAKYLGMEGKAIPIIRTEFEKPHLAPPYQDFEFNLSHTKNYFTLAITKDTPIGIDVENINKNTDIIGISNRFFHPEEHEQILKADNQEDCFFRIWTQKEALVKTIGAGIGFGFENFCVDAINAKVISINHNQYQANHFYSRLIKLPNEHYLCVTTKKNLDQLKIFKRLTS
jgi:4'-phosphopantetheinyl transferase